MVTHKAFGGVKLDNNTEISTEFDCPRVLNEGLSIRISKTGSDGHIFHVKVDGQFADGSWKELLCKTSELHFEDNTRSAPPFALR